MNYSHLLSVDGEKTAYLIKLVFGKDHLDEVLSEVFDEIFESRLADWCLDESLWPTNRTFAMFKDWFTIECHSVVIDLLDEPLESDS